MASDDTDAIDRRSVLKATGAALGGGGLLAASGSAAAGDLCLARTTDVYENCPPESILRGPTVTAGAEAFPACETDDDILFYMVADAEDSGYVRRYELEPC